MIETYSDVSQGYHPFLIRENFQVAQLNYLPKHGLDDIDQIEVHKQTDEVFILFEGRAVLIAANIEGESFSYEMISMKKGVTYNIPAGIWHNIAMDKDAQMIIVENANTHLHDCTFIDLSKTQQADLSLLIKNVLKK